MSQRKYEFVRKHGEKVYKRRINTKDRWFTIDEELKNQKKNLVVLVTIHFYFLFMVIKFTDNF